MRIDHIGWITNNIEKFEKFWVDILGFERFFESELSCEMANALFGTNTNVKCIKYQKDDMIVEIHVFDNKVPEPENRFDRFGINHIGLHVKNRTEFLKELNLNDDQVKVYNNPGGWQNIFIRDFEGNWIELKETFL